MATVSSGQWTEWAIVMQRQHAEGGHNIRSCQETGAVATRTRAVSWTVRGEAAVSRYCKGYPQ